MVVASVECDQRREPLTEGTRFLTGQAVWATLNRRRGDKWSRETEPERWDCMAFWEWIAALANDRTRVWVVANRADEFLTLTRFWQAVEGDVVSLIERPDTIRRREEGGKKRKIPWVGAFVLGQRVTIMEGVGKRGRFMVCSTSNWLGADTAAIAPSVGLAVPHEADGTLPGSSPVLEPDFDCRVWTRWFRSTILGFLARQLGNWQPTSAAIAVGIWRKTDGIYSARRHSNADVRHLEMGALHGGRGCVWFFGHVGDYDPDSHRGGPYPEPSIYPSLYGPVVKFDVSAQYAELLSREWFPRQLGGFWVRPKLSQVVSWCRYECCIASVRMRSPVPEYPHKDIHGMTYRAGEFRTTLAGPELLLAIEEGAVQEVYAAARYIPGHPFTQWGKAVLEWRAAEKLEGNRAGEWLAKQVSNSFAGKFAQRAKMWIDRPGIMSPVLWGEFPYPPHKDGRTRRCRAIAGRTRELVEMLPGRRLPAAVFAYLTSYARVQMRKWREAAGPSRILYQCTDSLIVRVGREGWTPPASWPIGTAPGQLKPEGTISDLRLYDANHWFGDGKWTLAGVPSNWWSDGRSTIRASMRDNPAIRGATQRPDSIGEIVRDFGLCQRPANVPVGPDGWLDEREPIVVPDDTQVPFSPGWQRSFLAEIEDL